MKYRKKPVVIEAIQFNNNFLEIREWMESYGFYDYMNPYNYMIVDDKESIKFLIKTLEGLMTVSQGDWMIRGVKGEFYPCKPDIFEETYEEVK